MDNSKYIILEEQIAKIKEVITALETSFGKDVEDEINFLSVVTNNLNELKQQTGND